MNKGIELDNSKLPPAMAAYKKREDVAEIIYDFVHRAQVTHRRVFADIPDDWKLEYRVVADRVIGRTNQP